MEITSFILGICTVIVVIIIAVIVAGVFKIGNITKEIKQIQESINWESKNQSDNVLENRLSTIEQISDWVKVVWVKKKVHLRYRAQAS